MPTPRRKPCSSSSKRGVRRCPWGAMSLPARTAETIVKKAVDTYGRLDVLFNNAGIWRGGTILDISEADWDRTMSVNVKGIYLVSRYAVQQMMRQESGSIINAASVAALRGSPDECCLHASKGAVLLLTKCMAVDFGRYGIRVNCTCPGIIDTQMADQLLTYRSLGDDDRKQALLETYEERHSCRSVRAAWGSGQGRPFPGLRRVIVCDRCGLVGGRWLLGGVIIIPPWSARR